MTDLSYEKTISPESKLLVHKAARSITDLQPTVSNVTDVILFLEILGYDNTTLPAPDFTSVSDFANHVYEVIGYFDEERVSEAELRTKQFESEVPSVSKRLFDGASLIFPWIGVLALLYLTGFSLWMSRALPADVTIAFIGGVFIGLITSEGQLNTFSRIFSFHYLQGNIVEARRIIKRHYLFSLMTISALSSILLIGGILYLIPPVLVMITIFGLVTISMHRASYMLLFSMKKLKEILFGFLIALVVFYSVFSALEPRTLSQNTDRYFISFTISFLALSIIPAYYHYKLFFAKKNVNSRSDMPNFYSPPSVTSATVKSRFGVQIWENLPNMIYGVFYFILLFGDRVISWFFTPQVLIAPNGVPLPFIFNSAYHVGADLALFTIIPGTLFQFLLLSVLYIKINNMSLTLKISETSVINDFIRFTYKKMIIISLLIGLAFAGLLNIFGPDIIHFLGGNDITVNILRVASFGSVFLSLLTGNAAMILFLNRAKYLAMITIACGIVLITVGMYLGTYGYGNIVYAYLISTLLAAAMSTVYVLRITKNSSSILLAKFS
ncbi:MAG: hypothetical protein ABJB85_04425 [Nitrososphaerota archaeon]